MVHSSFKNPKALAITPLLLALVFIIGCGGTAAEPIVVEKEVIKEVIKEVVVEKEVIKRVEVPVVVEKEVIREVIKEVVVVATAEAAGVGNIPPTIVAGQVAAMDVMAPARAIPEGKHGGFINMDQYADVRQRIIAQSGVLNMTLSPLFNTLMQFNPETPDFNDLRCDLCTSWELAADGVTYIFHLNPDAKWWDGVPVTAKDVVFSFESMVNPDQFPAIKGRSTSTHCNTALYFDSGNARAIDPKTVEVVVNFPAGGFFPAIANHTCVLIA